MSLNRNRRNAFKALAGAVAVNASGVGAFQDGSRQPQPDYSMVSSGGGIGGKYPPYVGRIVFLPAPGVLTNSLPVPTPPVPFSTPPPLGGGLGSCYASFALTPGAGYSVQLDAIYNSIFIKMGRVDNQYTFAALKYYSLAAVQLSCMFRLWRDKNVVCDWMSAYHHEFGETTQINANAYNGSAVPTEFARTVDSGHVMPNVEFDFVEFYVAMDVATNNIPGIPAGNEVFVWTPQVYLARAPAFFESRG